MSVRTYVGMFVCMYVRTCVCMCSHYTRNNNALSASFNKYKYIINKYTFSNNNSNTSKTNFKNKKKGNPLPDGV